MAIARIKKGFFHEYFFNILEFFVIFDINLQTRAKHVLLHLQDRLQFPQKLHEKSMLEQPLNLSMNYWMLGHPHL